MTQNLYLRYSGVGQSNVLVSLLVELVDHPLIEYLSTEFFIRSMHQHEILIFLKLLIDQNLKEG